MNTQACQVDLVVGPKGGVDPFVLLFSVELHFQRSRADKEVFLNGGVRGMVLEFPGPVLQFCARRENFDDQARRLQKITGSSITWVARDSDIGIEVTFLGRVLFPGITHWNAPGFLAYFGIAASGPGILGEMLMAALNVNAMLWRTSPAATEL
jgi:hypothetical protein